MPPIIDIHRATVYRGNTCVFTDFSLSLQEGEHVAILGPNGAGKSTFLKLLAGEVHPVPNDATRIRLFGEERWNVWDVRKRLGIVSHDLQASLHGECDRDKSCAIRLLCEHRHLWAARL